ncbi:MAG: hypothetical protein AAGD32_00885 [Planctomycetota bacterium]
MSSSWVPRLAPDVRPSLDRLPVSFQELFWDEIERLCADPSASRQSADSVPHFHSLPIELADGRLQVLLIQLEYDFGSRHVSVLSLRLGVEI